MLMNSDYYGGKLNMLGIHEHEAFCDTALVDALLHVAGDVDKRPAGGHFEPKFFAVALHGGLL